MIQRIPTTRSNATQRREPRTFPVEGFALVAVAFALRAAYTWLAMGPGATASSDAASYDSVAWNLARGVGFMLDGGTGPYPTAFVPPVLPYAVSTGLTVLSYGALCRGLLSGRMTASGHP